MDMFVFCTLLIMLVFALMFYKAYKNTKQVVMNHVYLSLQINQPKMFSLRILHISDLHLERISITPWQLNEKLKHQPIDIIALTGDFLDRKRTIPKLISYLYVLRKLDPTYGMYAVFGNHDYVLGKKHFQTLKKTLEEHGCRTLQNECEAIDVDGQPLNIIGIDDYSTNRSDISASYAGVKDGVKLVLTHDPNIVLEMRDVDYDYLLSGHFHGGQIHWPKPYHLIKMGKLVRMNMVKGLHLYHGKHFYISEGLGQTGMNIRVGSRPEITIHRLAFSRHKKSHENTLSAM